MDTSIDTLKAYPDSNIIVATWDNVDTFLLQQSILINKSSVVCYAVFLMLFFQSTEQDHYQTK